MAEQTEQPQITPATERADTSRQTSTVGQNASQPPPPPPGMEQVLIMAVPLLLVFYLMIWRPESKRRKQKESLLSAIKPKDNVITIGGLQGTVSEIDGDSVVLLVDPKKDVKLRFRRSAIETIVE